MNASPPTIFSAARRKARSLRVGPRHDSDDDAASFVIEDMADEIVERLQFLRYEPKQPLVMGDITESLAPQLTETVAVAPGTTIDLEHPFAAAEFDFIASLNQLDTINDLPGALIHIRNALSPGGLAIASFLGAGSLPRLRSAMLAAEPDRPAARMHPLVDSRAGAQLLQRAGWADPVVDTHDLQVRYSSLDRLVSDLRDQALGNVLAKPGPPLGKAARERARAAFLEQADEDGRVTETFAILTLSGRRPKR